jgi:diacylglycerol kinase family enzyme
MPSWQNQTIPVLLNRGSGTVADGPPEKIAELVKTEADALGIAVDIQLLLPEEIEVALKKVAVSGVSAVMVGGGDGTVMTAARHLMNTSCALVPLPFGTLNLLARDLGFPLDPAEAIRALARAEPIRIDVAEVNRRIFLCVAVLGFYPNHTWNQKEEYHGQWWRKIIWTSQQMASSYFQYPALSVEMKSKDMEHRIQTRSVAIFNNPFAEQLGLVPQRTDLRRGKLGVYVSRHKSWFSILRGIIAFVLGNLKMDQDLQTWETSEFVLKTRSKRKLKATLDGELIKFEQPLHFKIHPGALLVLTVPQDPA